ncbi:hypothetical protein F4861DRAFT_535116 [Xylaria intraflava]|nr:hypothetical protein F4861DRAFT_535116 [Xylaria intraflava]
MPRFPVSFRRKSTAADDQNGSIAEPSFRVLERPNSAHVKSFDNSFRLSKAVGHASKTHTPDLSMEDNLFAGLNSSRGSGSSNATKTGSDNSSRHSNVSMTPSSAEYMPPQEEWWSSNSRRQADHSISNIAPVPPIPPVPPVPPVHRSSGFLKQAGRTFSFGNKKNTPSVPLEEAAPPMPEFKTPATPGGRSRATTTSTVTAATPAKLADADFKLDLGGDWSSGMLTNFDKRSSVATLKERDAPNARPSQPSPLQVDHTPVEPAPKSWNSQHSNEALLEEPGPIYPNPVRTDQPAAPPAAAIPPEPNNESSDRRVSEDDSEDTTLLSDMTAASKFLSNDEADRAAANRSAHGSGLNGSYTNTSGYDARYDNEDIFDKSVGRQRFLPRIGGRPNSGQNRSNKVMTPEEFEKYRRDKVREERLGYKDPNESDKEEEEINYDDEEDDELEARKRLQKQRRKQEAHLSVYRQQMMKVTGESANPSPRPAVSMPSSTPNPPPGPAVSPGNAPTPTSDGSEDDEEVPLAILAAHGFPNKNRPPTRLSTMGSQTNLRASMQPPPVVGGGSVAGDAVSAGPSGGRLPPFARKLPQDPYLGAGLINQPPRESIALGGGSPAPSRPLPTGGLVGVIANEERARALRRGSPAVDHAKNGIPQLQMNHQGYDPISGIPPQMMYPASMQPTQAPTLTPGDQAQIQMNQQMHQFMQMQMQFMQMMATQNNSQHHAAPPPPQPMGHMTRLSAGQFPDTSRNSYLGGDPMRNSYLGMDAPRNSYLGGDMARNSMMGGDASRASFIGASMGSGMGSGLSLDVPQGPPQIRTMSMVQPSSASWIQQAPPANYTPSIHIQGGGYAPSIAPSERSNIGLPGRYRPVSSMGFDKSGRTSTMGATAQHAHSRLQAEPKVLSVNKDDEDDDDEGWTAMKAKREQKKSLWRSKKSFGSEIRALIN